MKNAFFLLAMAAGSLVSSCKSDGNAANNGTANTATVDKTVKQGELKKVLGKEIDSKFGLDVASEKVLYNAKYEYYLGADGKEMLHGKFNIETAESIDEFIERLKPADKTEDDEEVMGLHFDYSNDKLDGQFVDGAKDGKMNFSFAARDGASSGHIIYDAKTKGAVSAKFETDAEGFKSVYDGPVQKGTLKELFSLAKEVTE